MALSIEITESRATELARRLEAIRKHTESIVKPLDTEDLVVQSMPDVSPAKWHLGHTTWFFDEFILAPFVPGYRPFLKNSSRIFNSYYESVGKRVPRAARGHLSRPTVREVLEYRRNVTDALLELLSRQNNVGHAEAIHRMEILHRLEIGLHHEQQHQELLYTDIKFNLYQNCDPPQYSPYVPQVAPETIMRWIEIPGGLVNIGADSGFAYDNEKPVHKFYLEDFYVSDRPVSNAEFLEFINDDGYADFRHWLSDGWDIVRLNDWRCPLYWEEKDGEWFEYTLHGHRALDLHAPVTHISFHEALAFAAWKGQRLLTEFEWEHARSFEAVVGNFVESGFLHPTATPGNGLRQMSGDVWEWTTSAYLPYPGFQPLSGALGEYNGKFMNDQRVLRGGSCVTSASHRRPTYRNFFQGDKRWQFTGIRLAR